MRYFVYFILIIISFILQTTLFENIAIFDIKPNSMIILIVSIAFIRSDIEGAIVGFFYGLFIDIFFSSFLGLNAFIGAIVGFLAGKCFRSFYKNSLLIPFFLTFIFTFFTGFLFFFFNLFLRGQTKLISYLLYIIIPEVIYTAILSIPLCKIIYIINLRLEKFDKIKRNYFKE